jgi:predicted nucleic acid-binding protein
MGDDEVMQVVKDGRLTAYDAEYVALARRLTCLLVTTDTAILEHYADESISLADFVA